MNPDLIFQIALTQVPQIGPVHARSLYHQFGNAENIFKTSKRLLEKMEGIGSVRAGLISAYRDFSRCEKEISFADRNNIQILSYDSDVYPNRLKHCHDAPFILYYQGNANLNSSRIISVVGTRNQSDYGKQCCESLIESLAGSKVLVVSGLANGIDTIAHKSALAHQLKTVGVLGHGLDIIYPHANRNLASAMQTNGGLLTDFISGTKPDRNNFPARNRITAGICDALVVIESGISGGSLITAGFANDYNREVFAFPGSIHQPKSSGCHALIRDNKAALITGAADLMKMMNWEEKGVSNKPIQTQLFHSMNEQENKIYQQISQKDNCHIDELLTNSGFKNSVLASILLEMELRGIIKPLPGNRYGIRN